MHDLTAVVLSLVKRDPDVFLDWESEVRIWETEEDRGRLSRGRRVSRRLRETTLAAGSRLEFLVIGECGERGEGAATL
jgi:hypothetical protein